MSATGFQRRRRKLAARQAAEKAASDDNGGGGSGNGENGGGDTAVTINLTKLNKEKLIGFCQEKGLYEESYNDLTKAKIIEAITEKAKAKIVEAGIKTADEIAAIPEKEIFALFDTIEKQS